LNNPSQITITAGDLNFNVVMDQTSQVVGFVTLPNAIIKPGNNTMSAKMKMTSTDLYSLSTMLTSYLTGKVTPLTVKGTANSTRIIPLQPGLSQVTLKTSLRGIPASLVDSTVMDVSNLLSPKVAVNFNNPLDTSYTVEQVSADVYANIDSTYKKMGTISAALSPAVTVPAKGKIQSQYMPLEIADLLFAIKFLGLPADQKIVDVLQNVTIVVGESFHGAMYYEQKNVKVGMKDAAAALRAVQSMNATVTTTILEPTSTSIDSTITTTTSIETTEVPPITATTEGSVTTTEASQTVDSTTEAATAAETTFVIPP
jgi:hypothetical protein